jgi:hypothetical protein
MLSLIALAIVVPSIIWALRKEESRFDDIIKQLNLEESVI